MSSKMYVKNSVKGIEALLQRQIFSFPSGYNPELEVTPELNDHLPSRYLPLMGILRWSIKLH